MNSRYYIGNKTFFIYTYRRIRVIEKFLYLQVHAYRFCVTIKNFPKTHAQF